jgi:arginine N-succinyltransferase
MDYWEADQLSQKSKDFILSLFPSGKIYTTFLPAEARNAVGRVGKETEPVLHMLNKIGFKYRGHVDPFDGGPHLLAGVDEILPVQKIKRLKIDPSSLREASSGLELGLVCRADQKPGEFRSVTVRGMVQEDRLQIFEPNQELLFSALELNAGSQVVFMPYY